MRPSLPFACPLELHARYGSLDISTALGLTTIAQTGQTGVGVLHAPRLKAYAMLVTFQKTEREFSPSTMYADYPISRELFHWDWSPAYFRLGYLREAAPSTPTYVVISRTPIDRDPAA